MDLSDAERAFLHSLPPEDLLVGNGSDSRPVWVGVDAAQRRVFKIFASGRCQGFVSEAGASLLVFNGLSGPSEWTFRRARQVAGGDGSDLLKDDERIAVYGLQEPDQDSERDT
ncbi:hypothetical protein ABIC63_002094 [Pseudacidovorax sp. 1753]